MTVLETGECLRAIGSGINKDAIQRRSQRQAQAAVVVVTQGNEAKRLQTCALELLHRWQHFGHTVDGAFLSVKGNLDEIAAGKRLLQFEQSAGDGDGLKFPAFPLATFDMDGGSNGSVQLNSRGTLAGIGLGEVCHSRKRICHEKVFQWQVTKAPVHGRNRLENQ